MARRRRIDDVPSVYRRRSNFDLSHRVPTTMRVGALTPLDVVEVLPGDTWTMETVSLTRLATTFIRPIMDDVFLDTYTFFVPLRLCYNKLEQVFGDASPSAYSSPSYATIPFINNSNVIGGLKPAPSLTVWDYLGLPSGDVFSSDDDVISGDISLMPLRSFALIWNEFFRDQSVDQEVNVNLGDYTDAVGEAPNTNSWSPTNYAGNLPPVRRYGDLYSSCVVAPQKGPAVAIPGVAGAPVVTTSSSVLSGTHPSLTLLGSSDGSRVSDGSLSVISSSLAAASSSGLTSSNFLYPSNLVVADSTLNPDANINSLRTAFQLQKYLERDSVYGSRYREYLYSAYGVLSPDSRMQIPEFLAGSHNRLNIAQIPATSETDTYSVGQYSGNVNSLSEKSARFSKSFSEHGYIITVGCIRYKHLYSQSVPRLFRRKNRSDFYDPLFANLGQQAIYVHDVYGVSDSSSAGNPVVLGYNEAFADYRTIPDRVTAGMRPDNGNLGQYWSLSDRFDSAPSLIDLIHEDDTAFNRVVSAGAGSGNDPFVVDFNFPCSVARVVTPYSIPGYADHH